ncbi:MAG: A/G-specific adenine glycosylase [Acidimicrobiales bacterium]|nr:A/G-specific adenine glycosylase [Acidimicrobiales bacterium]
MTPLQRDLVDWWHVSGRDLPWRRTRDPWAVLVSEMMLQQTQVARVMDRWTEFLDRFPAPAACAASPRSAVVDAWAGLGYNRRAVHLHQTARECVERFGGSLPGTLDELQSLPGIGPYTARAVLVFAHEADIGLVDTNAGRFVSRALAGRRLTSGEAQQTADAAVPGNWGWTWGQAVFDLGALVCRRRSPRCDECPVRRHCAWAAAGWPSPDPVERSAGIGEPQSRFEGSDRQGRGRLVAALRAGFVRNLDLAQVMGWPEDPERAGRVAATLETDGLAVCVDDEWRLAD